MGVTLCPLYLHRESVGSVASLPSETTLSKTNTAPCDLCPADEAVAVIWTGILSDGCSSVLIFCMMASELSAIRDLTVSNVTMFALVSFNVFIGPDSNPRKFISSMVHFVADLGDEVNHRGNEFSRTKIVEETNCRDLWSSRKRVVEDSNRRGKKLSRIVILAIRFKRGLK